IEIIHTPTEKAEAEFVVHQIEKMLGGTGFFSMDSNRLTADDEAETLYAFSDFAVLYRTSSQVAALEEAFLRSGMPYQTSGAVSFFERRPIKDVLAYLRLLNNLKSDVDLLRVINTPPRGLGDRTVDELRAYCLGNRISLLEGIESQAIIQALTRPAHKALETFFSCLQTLQFEAAKNSVKGIIQVLLDEMGLRKLHGNSREAEDMWETLINLADSYGNRLDQFLADTALTREVDVQKRNIEKVSLMTLHASKGLEFPIVFIVGCENDLIPFRRNPLATQLSEAEIQEERRLLYVGMTRAEQRLFLTHSRKRTRFGREFHPELSPFLKNIEAAFKEMRHSMSGGKKRPKDNQLDLF
ncbi:ATP-binding domain-containing protein, partial [bacterium]|nr:ATP-binding domain-containing protein [bacterium]